VAHHSNIGKEINEVIEKALIDINDKFKE